MLSLLGLSCQYAADLGCVHRMKSLRSIRNLRMRTALICDRSMDLED